MTGSFPTAAAKGGGLLASLWAYADKRVASDLDVGRREGRPPVLAKGKDVLNVIVPEDQAEAAEVRGLIPAKARHRLYRSLRSSQALAQSVFGLLLLRQRLDVLAGLEAECGRPAFFAETGDWSGHLEHEIGTLNEPRPTSVDVWLKSTDGYRVAVECKFTESEFGRCSRPRLRPGQPGYPEQLCDGSYSIQRGRNTRCSLSEIGIRYWDFLPKLFDWPSGVDQAPCMFGETYQLGRNALAATIDENKHVDPSRGHALVVYDGRNPAFGPEGRAGRQWAAALSACRVPGLLRRISWQRILAAMDTDQAFDWLLEGMAGKYGLEPQVRERS